MALMPPGQYRLILHALLGKNHFERDCQSLQDQLSGMLVQHMGALPGAHVLIKYSNSKNAL
jgi:hypothetical protein